MSQEPKTVTCSICGKETTEYCEQLTCRACHVSLTFEECVSGAWTDEQRRAAAAWTPKRVT